MLKKVTKTALFVFIVLAVGIGAVYAYTRYELYNLRSIQRDPAAQLQKSFAKTAEVLKEGMAFQAPAAAVQAVKSGSVTLQLMTEGQPLSMAFYSRANGIIMILPNEETGVDNGIWLTDDAVVAYIPEILGEKAYGFSPTSLKADIKGAPVLDVLGITYEDAVILLDSFQTVTDETGNNKTEWKTLLDMKTQLDSLLASAAVSVEEGTLPIDTVKVDVYRVSYTFSPNQLCGALDLLQQYMLESDNYTKLLGNNPEAIQQFKDSIANAKEQLRNSNATAIIDFYLHDRSQVIVKADCRIDWLENTKGASVSASISLGENPQISGKYEVILNTNIPSSGKTETKLTYNRSHAHNLPGRTLVLKTKDESITLLDLQINSITGTFEMKLMDRALTFSGVCKETDTETSLNISSEELGEIGIIFTKDAEAPAIPKYINICYMSADALSDFWAAVEGDEPYVPEGNWIYTDITITGSDGIAHFYYPYHAFETLGELLVAEEIVELDEAGHIAACAGVPGSQWQIHIKGQLYEGNLNEVLLEDGDEISVIAGNLG